LLPLQQLPQLRMDSLEMVGAHSLYHLLEGNYHHQGLWSQVDWSWLAEIDILFCRLFD
jgi:hypothetical protein